MANELLERGPSDALPGYGDVDDALVRRAVSDLNRIYAAKGLETARAMAEYLLGNFFGGDIDNFELAGKKHVSYSFLWYSLAVLHQLRLLPDDVGAALTFSHHKLLLPVKDEQVKVDLARKAVVENLPVRALALEVRKIRAKASSAIRVGRPCLPIFVKGMGRINKAIEFATSEPLPDDPFASYDLEKAKELLVALDVQFEKLLEMKAQIEAKIYERESTTSD